MTRSIVATSLVILLAATVSFSQIPSSPNFFPHHKDDIWEYRDPLDTTRRYWNRIMTDTLGPDGNYYLETTLFGKLKVDTVRGEVWDNSWGGPLYSCLRYKLAADSGEIWKVTGPDSNPSHISRVRDVRRFYLFGVPAIIKRIEGLLPIEWVDFDRKMRSI
jgi:hypothetical protein